MLGLTLEKDGLNRPVREEDPSRARWICTANNLYTLGLHVSIRLITRTVQVTIILNTFTEARRPFVQRSVSLQSPQLGAVQ